MHGRPRLLPRLALILGCLTGAALGVASCSDDAMTEAEMGAGSYRGVLALPDSLVVVNLEIGSSALSTKHGGMHLPISGTLTFDDKTITVTGTLEDTSVTVSGGGFTLGGTLTNGVLDLLLTRVGGPPSKITLYSGGSSIVVYCGTYDGPKKGPLGIAVAGVRAAGGVGTATGGSVLLGTATVSSVALTGFPPSGKVDGTIAGGTIHGAWTDGVGGTGTVSATPAACPRGAPIGGDAAADGPTEAATDAPGDGPTDTAPDAVSDSGATDGVADATDGADGG